MVKENLLKVFSDIENGNSLGEKVTLVLAATARQREILLAGGLLNYTKDKEN